MVSPGVPTPHDHTRAKTEKRRQLIEEREQAFAAVPSGKRNPHEQMRAKMERRRRLLEAKAEAQRSPERQGEADVPHDGLQGVTPEAKLQPLCEAFKCGIYQTSADTKVREDADLGSTR